MLIKHRSKSGMTLAEILIVIGVLGLLVLLTLPRFMEAYRTGEENELSSRLQVGRQGLKLYHQEHGAWPSEIMILQLTTQTNLEGDCLPSGFEAASLETWVDSAHQVKDYCYGPYIEGSFPENPVDYSSRVTVVHWPLPDSIAEDMENPEGWIYSTATGEFRVYMRGETLYGEKYYNL